MGPPTLKHGRIAGRTFRKLDDWAEEHGSGYVFVESGIRLQRDPDTVRGPDVSYFAKGRLVPEQTDRGYPDVAPDLAVEVRSPNDTWSHLERKAQEYFAAGTKLVIFIEPDKFVELLRPNGERNRLGLNDVIEADDMLPGFRCRVRDLFPEEVE